MKKLLALLLAAILALTLCACKQTAPAAPAAIVDAGEVIANAVSTFLASDTFINTGAVAQQVTRAAHYHVKDLARAPMDGFLVYLKTDQDAVQLYLDSATLTAYDSITTNAADGIDLSIITTDEDRATYLLWMYGNLANGSYDGALLNDSETRTDFTADELVALNRALGFSTELITETTAPELQNVPLDEAIRAYLAASPLPSAQVTRVIHYQLDDFEGKPADGTLVNLATDSGSVQLYVDNYAAVTYDSITTNAADGIDIRTVTTDEQRATYLLWMFGSLVNGIYDGAFLNDEETRTDYTADELAALNSALGLEPYLGEEALELQNIPLDEAIRAYLDASPLPSAQVTRVLGYHVDDVDGKPADGTLVNLASENDSVQLYVDNYTGTTYDSITTNATNGIDVKTISTDEQRATYLLWTFGNLVNGSFDGALLNDSETRTEYTADQLAALNSALGLGPYLEEEAPELQNVPLDEALDEAIRTYLAASPLPSAQITRVVHYHIDDFNGKPADGTLVNLSTGSDNIQLYVDNNGVTYDSITTNAADGIDSTTISTDEQRATYLLWTFGNLVINDTDGVLLNDSETRTEYTADQLAALNSSIN